MGSQNNNLYNFKLIIFLNLIYFKSFKQSFIMILDQNNTIYTKACGKVLIAGGYGVLEKYNIGLTLAL